MTTETLTTPSQARRARIRNLEELAERIRSELTTLYRLEGYRPRTRENVEGVRTILDRRERISEQIRRRELAQLVPGKIVNEWAIRRGLRQRGIRGSVPTMLREAFIAAGHPGWTPPDEDTP